MLACWFLQEDPEVTRLAIVDATAAATAACESDEKLDLDATIADHVRKVPRCILAKDAWFAATANFSYTKPGGQRESDGSLKYHMPILALELFLARVKNDYKV